MKIKILLLLMLAHAPLAWSQTQWKLQPFLEYFGHVQGTAFGARVKGFVGSHSNNPYNVAVAGSPSLSSLSTLKFYSIISPKDTLPSWVIPGGADVEHGDFNGDGFTDFAVWKSLDFGRYDTVLIYLGNASGIDKIPALKLSAEKEQTYFGLRMCVGDLNNDRIDDLVITAVDYYQDFLGQGYGKVYAYFGRNYLKSVPAFTITGSYPGAHLGGICAMGDFNVDGFNDLAIYGYDVTVRDASFGYLKLYFGSAKFDTVADLNGPRSYRSSVTDLMVFDVNADHKADLLWTFSDSSTSKKSVLIHYGGSDFKQRFQAGPDFSIPEPLGSGLFGNAICNAGDINGDGDNDIVIAAKATAQENGIVFVYTGGKALDTRFDAARGQTLEGAFGSSVRSVGDINKDGYSDIIVGAPNQPWHRGQGYFGIFMGDRRIPTGVAAAKLEKIPSEFLLRSSYPNPFKFETSFEFSLSRRARIEIKVYDILGKEVKTLLDTEHSPGQYQAHWNGQDQVGQAAPNGVYFVRMRALSTNGVQSLFEQVQKFTLVR